MRSWQFGVVPERVVKQSHALTDGVVTLHPWCVKREDLLVVVQLLKN